MSAGDIFSRPFSKFILLHNGKEGDSNNFTGNTNDKTIVGEIVKNNIAVDFFTEKAKGIELEFRLGQYIRNKSNGSIKFEPGISKSKFDSLKIKLDSNKQYKYVNEKSIVYFGKESNLRQIVFNNGVIRFQIKRKIKSFDWDTLDTGIRLSLSNEIEIDSNEFKKGDGKRERNVHQYYYQQKSISFMISCAEIIEALPSYQKKTYEVEIEYTKPPEKKGFITQKLLPPLLELLEYIFNDRIALTSRKIYHEVMGDYMKWHSSKNREEQRIENKPINFKLLHILHLLNYNITNKLNGQNWDVIFSKYGVYLLRGSSLKLIARYSGEGDMKEAIGTILQVEEFDNKFWIYDVLSVKGHSLLEKNHNERIGSVKLDGIVFNPPITFIKKPFFYTQNPFVDVFSCKDYIEKTYKRPYDNNDGYIFTPIGSYFSGKILKFKFIQHLSVDFLVKKSAYKEDYLLDGYIGGSEKIFYSPEFAISKTIVNVSEMPDYKNIGDGNIVEAYFKGIETNSSKDRIALFIGMRVREDKDWPNSFKVADDVLEDSLYPLYTIDLYKILNHIYNKDQYELYHFYDEIKLPPLEKQYQKYFQEFSKDFQITDIDTSVINLFKKYLIETTKTNKRSENVFSLILLLDNIGKTNLYLLLDYTASYDEISMMLQNWKKSSDAMNDLYYLRKKEDLKQISKEIMKLGTIIISDISSCQDFSKTFDETTFLRIVEIIKKSENQELVKNFQDQYNRVKMCIPRGPFIHKNDKNEKSKIISDVLEKEKAKPLNVMK